MGNIPSRGTFCAGRVLRGRVRVGDTLEAHYQVEVVVVVVVSVGVVEVVVIGYTLDSSCQGKTSKGTVRDMEIYRWGRWSGWCWLDQDRNAGQARLYWRCWWWWYWWLLWCC